MTESVLRRLPDVEETTRVFGEVKKFDDVCQGVGRRLFHLTRNENQLQHLVGLSLAFRLSLSLSL